MTAFYRLPTDQRMTLAAGYVGQRVALTLKEPWHPRTGRVVAVATTVILGNTPGVLVIQVDHPTPGMKFRYPEAISLAQIARIQGRPS